jgi:tetratricopeptide (TPR) repeat protein
MNKKHEKAMLDLQRLMEAANLKTEADYDKFIKEFTGKTIPKFDREALSKEEQAQDLVYQAMEEDDLFVADQLIYQALQLDSACIEAYEFMGDIAGSPLLSLTFYEKAVDLARKKLGVAFFKKNTGHFWGIHETRPFMRCLKNYAECLYIFEQKEAALTIFLELLTLNPNDNQGIRDQAGLYCLELGKIDRFETLNKEYEEDATAFHHFNTALSEFIKFGDNTVSRNTLAKAREVNKHVLQLMLTKKELPALPEHYGFGDKNEAIYYCTLAKDVWHNVPGAIGWLEAVYNKR